MTGGEITPIATGMAKKVLSEDMTDKQLLAELAKDHPAAIEAADRWAKRLAIKQGLLYRIYSPLARLAGTSKDYFENDFASDMTAKVEDIPDENLTSPKASVAAPAMEALGYSLDEPELKEMYLNLLATATDNRVSDTAHPSFAQVIRQLSAGEATLLPTLLKEGIHAIVQVTKPNAGGGYSKLMNNLVNLRNANGAVVNSAVPVWIDNWIRLGLVDVDFQISVTRDGAYDWVRTRPEFATCAATAGVEPSALDMNKGVLTATDFGLRFAQVVFPPPRHVIT